ncbi:MAG TPA: LssY C-terminal domain-containing protein [Candidatus Acidoferrum sp.]|nr:LssY C-terminal domain-containing protein [Candidatus Acidoferrum sp.]
MRIAPAASTIFAAILLACALAPATYSAQAASNSQKSYELDVDATKQWLDTNIDLRAGEKLSITATGQLTYPAPQSAKSQTPQTFGPDGLSRGWKDLLHEYAVPDGGHGALIARLGSDDAAQPFLVGASKEYTAPVAGRLFLGINQSLKDGAAAQGSFHVKIDVLDPGLSEAAAAVVGGPADAPIAGITSALLDKIPRRVSDPQSNPGDMVNLLIVGTQDEVVNVFATAGWVQVDKSVQDTLLEGALATIAKKDYLTMPMSTLYLFGRAQDFGFAHAEPVRVVMSRNHLRVWKSPYELDGRPIWCVAATHDIGFERDQRNNGVTHKIDPAIDGERDYVNATLSATGFVAQRDHVTPPNALTTAKTATGGEFHSDGRIVVLVLKSGTPASASN